MSRPRISRPRLRFDTLESRTVMSVVYNDLTQVLEITGTNGTDTFFCSQPDENTLRVAVGLTPSQEIIDFDLDAQPIVLVSADLRSGNDAFACDDTMTIPVNANGEAGLDFLRGGTADDILFGGDNGDIVAGGVGNDTLQGGDGRDLLQGGADDDLINGGDLNDTLFGAGGNDTLFGGTGSDHAHGDDGDDQILGQAQNDFLWGDQGFDLIVGGDDHFDVIRGGTEDDTLVGGMGNDSLFGDQGVDVLSGESGNDWLDGGADNDAMDGGVNRDTLVGGDGNDNLEGGDGADRLSGDGRDSTAPGDDVLRGGNGRDTANGDGGDDTIRGDAGNDTLIGGAGDDEAHGNRGNDRVRGGSGKDRLYGGEDNDVLLGEDDEDQVFGDDGTDTLDGGNHDDVLVSIDDDTLDTLWGRGGDYDSFWVDKNLLSRDQIMDAGSEESETNIHAVESFRNGADKTMDGDGIIDPSGGESSTNFTGKPLFSSVGPAVTDINQGALGDCWLLGSLASAVNITPNVARQLIVDLGDGTYAVHLRDQILNTNRFFRLDADLPVTLDNPNVPQFAQFGAEDSLWVALVEKAMAMDDGNDYQRLDGGTPYYPLGRIGGTGRNLYRIDDGVSAATDIFNFGLAGTYCTRNNQANALDTVANHGYGIIAILIGLKGEVTGVTLYNPHGVDNVPQWNSDGTPQLDSNGDQIFASVDGADDGFITLNMNQFASNASDPIGVFTANYNAYL